MEKFKIAFRLNFNILVVPCILKARSGGDISISASSKLSMNTETVLHALSIHKKKKKQVGVANDYSIINPIWIKRSARKNGGICK